MLREESFTLGLLGGSTVPAYRLQGTGESYTPSIFSKKKKKNGERYFSAVAGERGAGVEG
jgi:hypothetical protein